MPKEPAKVAFGFQVDVEAVPYNPETVQYLFGKGTTHNPDYPVDTMARDVIFEMVKDAITYVLQAKMDYIVQHKIEDTDKLEGRQKDFWQYLEEKEAQYRRIESSIKSLPRTL